MRMPRKVKAAKNPVGKRLQAIREAQGLSQEEAAKKVGVTRPTWVRWETGIRQPGKSHLMLIDMLAKKKL